MQANRITGERLKEIRFHIESDKCWHIHAVQRSVCFKYSIFEGFLCASSGCRNFRIIHSKSFPQFHVFKNSVSKHPSKISKLQNYIVHYGIFTVHLRMALIFTDFPTGSGSQPCAGVCGIFFHSKHMYLVTFLNTFYSSFETYPV